MNFLTPDDAVAADGRVQAWLFRGDVYKGTFRHVLTADFQFDLTNGTDQVCGTVSDTHLDKNYSWVPPTWVAQLTGNRALFNSRTNPAPQAGAYTLIFPGGDGTNEPAGMGFAVVNVEAGGHVRMSGFLADGTAISQRTAISKDGRWPMFVNLYQGHGSVLGWLAFSNDTHTCLAGTIAWTRPAMALAKFYPGGFENALEVAGVRYTRPMGGLPWNFTNGVVIFAGGGLNAALTNSFVCGQKGRIISTSGKKFSLKAISPTGLFYGNANAPGTGITIKFKGAVLQNQNCGYGYFLGTNQSGTVTLQEE